MTKTIENGSGLRPVGHAILGIAHEPPERKNSSIIIPEAVREREVTTDQKVRIVALGTNVWRDEPPRADVGNLVLVAKFAGYAAKGADGKMYRLFNDTDIFAVVEKEVDYV